VTGITEAYNGLLWPTITTLTALVLYKGCCITTINIGSLCWRTFQVPEFAEDSRPPVHLTHTAVLGSQVLPLDGELEDNNTR
jgi:hypothetical protein